MDHRIFVGLVGKPRAGKGAVVSRTRKLFLKPDSVEQFSFGTPLREALAIFGLPYIRSNTSQLVEFLDRLGGENTVSMATINRAQESTAKIVFLDGIRRHIDLKNLRKLPNNFLLHVHASPRVRWLRALEAARSDPDAKPDEAGISFEAFLRQDELPTERFIDDLILQAQKTIINESDDFKELDQQIQEIFKEHLSLATSV